MKKHIVFYVDSMQPAGGIERVVSTIVNKLSPFYRITLLVKDNPSSFYKINDEITMISLDCPIILNMHSRTQRYKERFCNIFESATKLRKAIKGLSPDFIYVTTPYACLETQIAGIAPSKVILSEHGARTNYNWVFRFLQKIQYKKYPIHIVASKYETDWYRQQGYNSTHIPHFVSDLKAVKPDLNSKLAINIGRLTDDKNQITLLRIWKKLIDNRVASDWKLMIVGEGENEQLISDYINNNELNKYVSVIPPTKNISDLYARASLYLCTSRSEGYSLVLLEALSIGLPIVAFNCSEGTSEILSDNGGILVPMGDEKAYFENLSELINSYSSRLEQSKRALLASQKWSDHRIIEKWKKTIERDSNSLI